MTLDPGHWAPNGTDGCYHHHGGTLPCPDQSAELTEREAAPCEYRETPDDRYPHLVWPQCSCGWQGAGARRPELAQIAHMRHVLAS